MAHLVLTDSLYGEIGFNHAAPAPAPAGRLCIRIPAADGHPAEDIPVPLFQEIQDQEERYVVPSVSFVDMRLQEYVQLMNPPPLPNARAVNCLTNQFVSKFHLNREDGCIRLSREGSAFVSAFLRYLGEYYTHNNVYGDMNQLPWRVFITIDNQLKHNHMYSIKIVPHPNGNGGTLEEDCRGIYQFVFGSVLPRKNCYHVHTGSGVHLRFSPELRSFRKDLKDAFVNAAGNPRSFATRLIELSYRPCLWPQEKRDNYYFHYNAIKGDMAGNTTFEQSLKDMILYDDSSVVPGYKDWCEIAARSQCSEMRDVFWYEVPERVWDKRRYQGPEDFPSFVCSFYRHPRNLSRLDIEYELCKHFPFYLEELATVFEDNDVEADG